MNGTAVSLKMNTLLNFFAVVIILQIATICLGYTAYALISKSINVHSIYSQDAWTECASLRGDVVNLQREIQEANDDTILIKIAPSECDDER